MHTKEKIKQISYGIIYSNLHILFLQFEEMSQFKRYFQSYFF